MQVSKEGFELHTQKPYEFMDSPEWVALSEDEDKDSIFGVSCQQYVFNCPCVYQNPHLNRTPQMLFTNLYFMHVCLVW